jgi:hypothetical protein
MWRYAFLAKQHEIIPRLGLFPTLFHRASINVKAEQGEEEIEKCHTGNNNP